MARKRLERASHVRLFQQQVEIFHVLLSYTDTTTRLSYETHIRSIGGDAHTTTVSCVPCATGGSLR